jgi:hypothetical protein
MNFKKAIILTEQGIVAGPATQSANVKGLPKVVGPIVRRKVLAGYVADVRKRKKRKKVEEQHEAGLAPPTQLATYQDLEYQKKHWAGTRPEYKLKKDYFNQPTKKKKKKKDDDEVKSSVTVEQYNSMKTVDVPANYLNRSMTPFFYGQGKSEREHKPKTNYFSKPPKKKKKVKNETK